MASNILDEDLPTVDYTLHYWLFPYDEDWVPIVEENQLQNLISEYMGSLYLDIKDYIWNDEPFSLAIFNQSSDDKSGFRSHIRGKMVIGDYLEDEWFVVFLLRKLSKVFPDLVCRVFDSDGEFLLIEAAHHLPSWAKPETAEGRVYLREGLLHIVPPSILPISTDSPTPQITMASVGHVAHSPSATLANPVIQNAISLRIEEYPRKISKDHHNTHAYVPIGVAALLHEYPTLVSAAVRAFCNKDYRDNKCLRVMKHFPPEVRVMTSVRFSKALYAQLAAHSFTPDRKTGWKIPSYNTAHDIGMKLACGFEILVCSAGGLTPSAMTPEEEAKEDPAEDNNPLWIKYKNSLKDKGYFRGEMEGSKLFKELEANARRFFVSNKMMTSKDNDVSDNLSVGSVVVKLLSKINPDYEAFKDKEIMLQPPDDEEWLEIDPTTFDAMLDTKFQINIDKKKMKTPDPFLPFYDGLEAPQQALESVKHFLDQLSSVDGVEFPDDIEYPLRRKIISEGRNAGAEAIRPPLEFRTLSTEARRRSSTGTGRKTSAGANQKKLSSSGLLNLHHPQFRKISSHSNTSDASDMSSFSAKVDFNSEAFTDALNNVLEYSVPEDDYFVGDEEGSSGMSSYEDDNDDDVALGRKISDGSNTSKTSSTSKASSTSKTSSTSKASSGVEVEGPPPPQRPPRRKKSSKSTKKKIPLASFDDFLEDSDDDEEAMSKLLASYQLEGGAGPTTSLFSSLGLNAPKK